MPVVDRVAHAQEIYEKNWIRVHHDGNTPGVWLIEESQYLQLKSEASNAGIDFGNYLKDKLQLPGPSKPTKASYFKPQQDEYMSYRESIVHNPSSANDSYSQIEILLEEGERLFDNMFKLKEVFQ